MPEETTKHPDQIKREKIPTRSALTTLYQPCMDLLMIIPIPDITQVGKIILPNKSHVQANEGHVIAKGPLCSDNIKVGACVLWDEHSEMRYSTDDDSMKFVTVRESSIALCIQPEDLHASAGRRAPNIKKYKPQAEGKHEPKTADSAE